MKTVIVLGLLLSMVSCSLIERRKEHFSYIKPGITLKEVLKTSGEPAKKGFKDNEVAMRYEYCATPVAKDMLLGILTFTVYAWSCKLETVEMDMYFRDGVLYRMEDDVNAAERAAANRAMASAISSAGQQMSEGVSRQTQQNMYQQQMNGNTTRPVNCQSNTYGGTTYTNCK